MNKKITAVTLSALIVLTMFTALVPSASAAKEVAAPYEFLGVTDKYDTDANSTIPYFNLTATSAANPSLLYFDLDDEKGAETISAKSGLGEDNMTIGKGNLTYTTTPWVDPDTPTDSYIAWLGAKYYVADNGSTWRICEKLVDEDEDDDHLLRVGESLTLVEGWAITAMEIDVDGGEAWMSLTQDGEEVDNEVVQESKHFEYKEDLGATDKTVVMNFTVETVFAGMNTNLVKVSNIDLVSNDVVEVKNGDEDLMTDYKVTADGTQITIKNDEDVSLSEDDVVDILGDRFGIRVNDDSTVAAIVRVITEPGTYELMGVTAENGTGSPYFDLSATSSANPSLLYYDLDDKDGDESISAKSGYAEDNKTIGKGNLTYTTKPWVDPDTTTDSYIAWLGAKYYVADNGSTWRICEKLVDEDEDDDHLLRVGESLSLAEGWAITAMEIDVDGGEAWISLTQDGEEVDNEVVQESKHFEYKEDLGATDKTVVMNFTVETVFAGMNTNLVKVSNIDLISNDVVEVKNGDEDLMTDYKVTATGTQITIKNDEDISLSDDDVVDILGGRFGIRVNDPGTMAAIVQTVIVGGGAVATEAPDEDVTEVATEPTNVTDDVTVDDTAAPPVDAEETTEVPEPTPEPGFEAVFAITGLLAVAYLVLRQRE